MHYDTAAEALAAWDRGDIVTTIEMGMGGVGPGYEQAIHVAVFEIIRDMDPALATAETQGAFVARADETIRRISREGENLGFSGAQVGAAMHLAFRALRDGWAAMLASAPADRHMMVSRTWPRIDRS